MNPKEAIVRRFQSEGIDTLFTLMSEDNMELIATIKNDWEESFNIVNVRHEQNAVAMADGFSRAGDQIGVVTVGRGPAIAQTGTALRTSEKNGSDIMILVPTYSTRSTFDLKRFQQKSYLELMVGEATSVQHHETLLPTINDTFRKLYAGEGPIAVEIPMDILNSDDNINSDSITKKINTGDHSKSRVHPDENSIGEAIELYDKSDKTSAPIIIVGQGAVKADAKDSIAKLAEQIEAYLVTTIQAQGYFSDHPFSLGVMGGWGSDLANEFVDKTDFILALGCSLNPYTTSAVDFARNNTKTVHVDTNESSFERYTPVKISILGDAKIASDIFLNKFQNLQIDQTNEFWTDSIRERIAQHTKLDIKKSIDKSNRLDPNDVVNQLNSILPEDRFIILDAGYCVRWVVDGIELPHPNDRIWSQNFNSIGLGLPMGVGATLANSNKSCIAFCGDAGFMMSLPALETAVRNNVPLVIVVMNDNALGTEYDNLTQSGIPGDSALVDSPDFESIAQSFGADGYTASSVSDIKNIEQRLNDVTSKPVVINCKIDREVRHRDKK